jgi:hypothetical protein
VHVAGFGFRAIPFQIVWPAQWVPKSHPANLYFELFYVKVEIPPEISLN